ncbi:MAG: ion channel [Alphaproteobacteria bacterium]
MTNQLIVQLIVATGMVVVTVLIHLAGLGILIMLMRFHGERFSTSKAIFNQLVAIIGVAFGLFALHTIEIWSYAVVHDLLRATPDFESALYFSTVTYATIGYGDLTLTRPWRILGAIEGADGILLMEWSTAFFVSVVARMRTVEHDWLRGDEP